MNLRLCPLRPSRGTPTTLLMCVLLCLACGGCAWRAQGGAGLRPLEPADGAPIDAAAIAARLQARAATRLTTLQASATGVVETPEEGRRPFHATLIAEVPESLRFRASREPIGELFQLIQQGDTLTFHLTREREAYTGTTADLHPSAGLLARLQPMRLLQALTAYDELARVAPEASIERVGTSSLRMIAPGRYPGVSEAEYVMDEATLDLQRIVLRGPGGADDILASVVYQGWMQESGVELPRMVVVALPPQRTSVTLENPRYRVNPALRPGSFEAPGGVPVYPLGALRFVEPEPAAADSRSETGREGSTGTR